MDQPQNQGPRELPRNGSTKEQTLRSLMTRTRSMPETGRASRSARSSISGNAEMGKRNPAAQTKEATNATNAWELTGTKLFGVRGPRRPEPIRRGAMAKVGRSHQRSRHNPRELILRRGRILALQNQRKRWQPSQNQQSTWYRQKDKQLHRLRREKGEIHGILRQSHLRAEALQGCHPHRTATNPQAKQKASSHLPHSG